MRVMRIEDRGYIPEAVPGDRGAVSDLNDALTPGSAIIDNTAMAAKQNSLFVPPILAGKELTASSVFEPANLLREARRQREIPEADIPAICVLDPDGDILRALRRERRASLPTAWACYHTQLYEFDYEGE